LIARTADQDRSLSIARTVLTFDERQVVSLDSQGNRFSQLDQQQ